MAEIPKNNLITRTYSYEREILLKDGSKVKVMQNQMHIRKKPKLVIDEDKIYSLLERRISITKICKELNINRYQVDKIVRKYNKQMVEKIENK